jgi:hypothetical protein
MLGILFFAGALLLALGLWMISRTVGHIGRHRA